MKIRAFPIETASPDDTRQLRRYFDEGVIDAEDVLCIVGKTEGNGGRNDFTRALAMTALEELFAARLGVPKESVQDRIIFSMSGGTEGVVTPHIVVFTKEGEKSSTRFKDKRLAVAIGHTRPFRPEEIGRTAQIEETARALRRIVDEMQLDDPRDVHLVQMKGAIPPVDPAQLGAGGLRCDMVYSRAASALGVGLALGEIAERDISDDVVCRDFSLYSSVASCSAKPGLTRTELMVFANSAYWEGDLAIEHGVLEDILDVRGIHDVAGRLGFSLTVPPDPDQVDKLVAIFAKSEADPRGSIRGHRHTMLTDDDISDTRYSRCVLSSVLAATLGTPRVYVSTRAEHHGPLGGGPLALIARVGADGGE